MSEKREGGRNEGVSGFFSLKREGVDERVSTTEDTCIIERGRAGVKR